ncbi:hypothetical protein OROHE_012558 [Orobanche hederae]
MGDNKDVAWKYARALSEGSSVRLCCNFCGKVTTGGVFRMKEHLAGGKRNATSCKKVTEEVRKEVADFMESEHLVGGNMNSALRKPPKMKGPMDVFLTPDPEIVVRKRNGKQPKIDENDGARKELRKRACKAFAKWMAIRTGPGMKPPSYHEVRVPLLKEEVADANQLMKAHEAEWVTYGCSLMCDGWEDRKHRCLIKFLVNTPRGSFFLESVDASAVAKTGDMLFELISKYVEMIGPKNVVQVVTDSASNNKAAGRMLMIRYQHLFWTPCAAHCIDLMLEDIFNIERLKKCIKKGMKLNAFIYTKPALVNMLREFTGERELLRPAKTRFATAFLTLSRINNQKANLRKMFQSERWQKSNYSKDPIGRNIAGFIATANFWNNVVCSLKVAGPLVKVLRLVDGEKKPPMGYIYEAMDRAKETIARAFDHDEHKYKTFFEIIDNRWDVQLHQPLHAAAYYLNPEFYYTNSDIENDKEVSLGLYKCLERMVDDDVQDQIGDQLELYKRAEGFFGLPMAIRQRSSKSPAACIFEHLHSKKRNRLAQQKLNDLVFVKYNRALKRRYEIRDVINPILLNEIDDSNEWLIGKMDGDNEEEDDEFVFSREDGLTHKDVAKASGAGEPRYNSRSNASRGSSKVNKKGTSTSEQSSKRRLIDESEDEEDEIEFNEGDRDKNPNTDQNLNDEDFENLEEEPENY